MLHPIFLIPIGQNPIAIKSSNIYKRKDMIQSLKDNWIHTLQSARNSFWRRLTHGLSAISQDLHRF